MESVLHGDCRCQPSARRHQGAGRRRHPAAEGRQGRSAHLPCIRSFLSGQYVLSGLQSAVCVGRPWHPLHGEGRNDTQPQIHPRYAGRCLFQDRRRPDRGSAADHRRVLLGAEVPFQPEGRLCFCSPFLPLLSEVGRVYRRREGSAGKRSRNDDARPRSERQAGTAVGRRTDPASHDGLYRLLAQVQSAAADLDNRCSRHFVRSLQCLHRVLPR